MRPIPNSQSRLYLSRARRLMTDALAILDALDAPGDIGSTLDLAIAKLEKYLDGDDRLATDAKALMSQLQREFADAGTREQKPNPWALPRD